MFLTSGRPVRSRRTASLPRASVSPTYATEDFGAVDLDDDAEHVLAVQVDRTRLSEGQLAGFDGLEGRRGVHDERIPARSREDSRPVPFWCLPHPDRDRLTAGKATT